MAGTPTPDGPRALLSPDGTLLAWRTSAKHYHWRCTDGYDRSDENVADWTTLVPAVSVSPEDTGLRERIAEAMYRAWQGSSPLSFAEQADDVRGEYLRAADEALPVFEQAHGDLVVRAANLRAQRDAARAESAHRSDVIAHLQFENEVLRTASRSTPALPDGAAVDRVAAWLVRVKVYGVNSTERDEQVRRQWTNVFTADEQEVWRREARDLLADLGLSSPATDPADEVEHRHDPAEDVGCTNPPAVSCSDPGCPRHGWDTEEGDDDE
jgi:hypothetical protein